MPISCDELFEVGFEQIGARAVAPAPIAQEQQRIGIRIEGLPVGLPPLAEAVTGEFTGIMARPQGDIALIPLHIINAMRDDDPLGEARKVMIPGLARSPGYRACPDGRNCQSTLFFRVDAHDRIPTRRCSPP